METSKNVYHEKNDIVTVERVFSQEKTITQLILELVKKQYEG